MGVRGISVGRNMWGKPVDVRGMATATGGSGRVYGRVGLGDGEQEAETWPPAYVLREREGHRRFKAAMEAKMEAAQGPEAVRARAARKRAHLEREEARRGGVAQVFAAVRTFFTNIGLAPPRFGMRSKWRRVRMIGRRSDLSAWGRVRAIGVQVGEWARGGQRGVRDAIYVHVPGRWGEFWRGLRLGEPWDWMEPRRSGAITAALRRQSFRERATVAWWVTASAAMVAVMVVVGGVTRLTKSGLSMTEWRLTGEKYPSTEEEWRDAWDKYRASPEGQSGVHDPNMSMDDFQFIYYMEWLHRQLGRWTGMVYGVPFLTLVGLGIVRPFSNRLGRRLLLLLGLGGSQGLVGWWMVRSGLEDGGFRVQEADVPRVSPYRLASHLTMAFGIYAGLVWTALGLFALPHRTTPLAPRFGRLVVAPFSALVGITAISGAFVAGLEAGHAFNDWPLYNGAVFRPVDELTELTPAWRNLFENTALVQTDHRMLAYTTLACSLGVAYLARRRRVHPSVQKLATAVALVACGQASLGILTLVNHVPVELGSAHQAGALLLFTVTLATLHACVGTRAVLHGSKTIHRQAMVLSGELLPQSLARRHPVRPPGMLRSALDSAVYVIRRINGGRSAVESERMDLRLAKKKRDQRIRRAQRKRSGPSPEAAKIRAAEALEAARAISRQNARPKRVYNVWAGPAARGIRPDSLRVTPPAFHTKSKSSKSKSRAK